MNKSGVYKIICLITGKFYLGSSNNIPKRLNSHSRSLKNGNHYNLKLQRAWNKHGEANFKFEVVEYCEKELLIAREQYYIDKYDVCKKGFNICPIAYSKAEVIVSLETRKKIGIKSRGNKYAVGHKSVGMLGKNQSEETKQKIRSAMKGHTYSLGIIRSKETKQKISNAMKGRAFSDEHRLNLSKSRKGQTFSEETRRRMSEAKKGNTNACGKHSALLGNK